jgi:flagellar basal-body rod protein FlgG
MSQGSLQATEKPLDTAIEGNGMYEVNTFVRDANNNLIPQKAWTRNGSFELTPTDDPATLFLTTKDGYYVVGADDQPVQVPVSHKLNILPDGRIMAYDDADKTAPPVEVAQIKMVRVIRPQLLQQLGENLFSLPTGLANPEDILQTVDEGNNTVDPITVRQGFLEQSNVTLAEEMTELIQVQRAFQLNSRAVTSSDTMMGIANNLRNG